MVAQKELTTGERLVSLEIKLDALTDKIDELLTRVVTTTFLKAALQEHAINCPASKPTAGYTDLIKLLTAVAAALIGGGAGGFFLGQ